MHVTRSASFFVLLLPFAILPGSAQAGCWLDEKGEVVCSDKPRPRVGGGDLMENPELQELLKEHEFQQRLELWKEQNNL